MELLILFGMAGLFAIGSMIYLLVEDRKKKKSGVVKMEEK